MRFPTLLALFLLPSLAVGQGPQSSNRGSVRDIPNPEAAQHHHAVPTRRLHKSHRRLTEEDLRIRPWAIYRGRAIHS
ncbi:hypothetical protein C2E23DRAFT_568798 [Lenzites betulinus]|nr:hypothetical protein C2E23DRAFT_568798 [Lenzites betulinus]